MKSRLILERTLLILSVFMLAGTNRCRDDYYFATKTDIAPTGTVTGTITVTGTVDPDATGTATPTPTTDGTDLPDPTETPGADDTPSPTPTATPTTNATTSSLTLGRSAAVHVGNAVENQGTTGLLSELATLDIPNPIATPTSSAQDPNTQGKMAGAAAQLDSNWLGTIYDDSKDSGSADKNNRKFSAQDSDRDGYADELEELERTDPKVSNNFPDWVKSSSLSQRLIGSDDDGDGVSNSEERAQGTDPFKKDSDTDGISDGAERLSGSNPLSADSTPIDGDKDGLSDDFERAQGTNEYNVDSDGDGASDSVEAALGTNPISRDSDQDGISDGREIQNGTDPLVPETK